MVYHVVRWIKTVIGVVRYLTKARQLQVANAACLQRGQTGRSSLVDLTVSSRVFAGLGPDIYLGLLETALRSLHSEAGGSLTPGVVRVVVDHVALFKCSK